MNKVAKSNGKEPDCSNMVNNFDLPILSSKIELAEEYSRRDCLLFHGLTEKGPGENNAQKIVETAQAMGLDLTPWKLR